MLTEIDWLFTTLIKMWDRIATPLGLLMAVAVTGHVLLSKRDVAASIGWIGLAWLSPVWGSLLYFVFGINRVVRRAKRLARQRRTRDRTTNPPALDVVDHLKPLEHAVRRITNRTADSHNTVQVFHNGDEAYPAMLNAIDGARRSVALSTYIMRDDSVGSRFVEALAAAQARGVEVRVLIDGIGSGYFRPSIYRHLRRAGIPVGRFMHSAMPWRMPFLNLRSHKKLLVVDGAAGFTGGVNIAAENVIADRPPYPVCDTHFLFEGPVVGQLADAFAQDWVFVTGEELSGPLWFPNLPPKGNAMARVVSSGPDQDLEKIQAVLLEAIACARATIRLMTPYFLPSEELVSALSLAAMRGVKVDIIVPEKSNHWYVDVAMRAHVGPLLQHGVRIWRAPPPFNHSKLMVVDQLWCSVGSANWDMRSLRLNFELNVEVYDADLAANLGGGMRAMQQHRLKPHELNARSLPERLRDAGIRLLLPYI